MFFSKANKNQEYFVVWQTQKLGTLNFNINLEWDQDLRKLLRVDIYCSNNGSSRSVLMFKSIKEIII